MWDFQSIKKIECNTRVTVSHTVDYSNNQIEDHSKSALAIDKIKYTYQNMLILLLQSFLIISKKKVIDFSRSWNFCWRKNKPRSCNYPAIPISEQYIASKCTIPVAVPSIMLGKLCYLLCRQVFSFGCRFAYLYGCFTIIIVFDYVSYSYLCIVSSKYNLHIWYWLA